MLMTPREIAIVAHGFNERQRETHKHEMIIARTTAWMIRCEARQFPTLAQLVPGPPLTREQRAAQNRERMDELKERRNKTWARQEKKRKKANG